MLFSSLSGFKCPICSKSVASDEMEMHFIMCLSKPRLSYNDDVLTKDAGECVICLEELLQGDTIARLPCLCIYHKRHPGRPAYPQGDTLRCCHGEMQQLSASWSTTDFFRPTQGQTALFLGGGSSDTGQS
ncbi:hypothetical protein A6R68_20415 [Neotoma lepida]|uniref:RING-type E3 ubiquitin transferase n=1 Tax=Neotoma lepida TaxID=56216 RepID=A0A1A6HUH0_NEOLE|nr:hypothetical protein A6R68_20415 [Neotoma lepida]